MPFPIHQLGVGSRASVAQRLMISFRLGPSLKSTHPDFEYQPLLPPAEVGDAGRVRWVSGTPGKPPAYAGPILSSPGTAALLRSISFSTIFLTQAARGLRGPWPGGMDEAKDLPPAGRVRFIEFGAFIANGAFSNHSCAFNRVNCRVGWLAPRSKTPLRSA